ncbi:MAG TPA: PDDEXK nuclease domain-containing protein [Steroidobacteraceae bacterium]|nr:PDDEXK nuclease domain-containing protein [Steroidobacteraceae bacterium]
MTDKGEQLNFTGLVEAIRQVHEHCASQAGKAINVSLTLRNWVIGYYILEYEQRGADRADYGERLLESLSDRLQHVGMSRVEPRELRRYRQFYLAYSRIWESLTPELRRLSSDIGLPVPEIRDSATPEFVLAGSTLITSAVVYSLERAHRNRRSARACVLRGRMHPGELVGARAQVFEFLGLRSREVMGESDLEDAVLDRLQEFLLELGHGFCFEARQKRILIGDAHGFVDLVFYHRILKCHVLVELKVAEFNHEHMGQLNTYVSWYKRNVMIAGDNPPVGILLCTRKDHALVEYALADMDNRLFVSKYQLELPSREEIQRFVDAQIREHR